MADISNPTCFSEADRKLIAKTLANVEFSHASWNEDELAVLRSFMRNHYRDMQLGVCAFCRNAVSLQSASNCHVEHIAPKSLYRHFMFEPKNLCVICADCNEIKRDQEVMNDVPDTVVRGVTRRRYPRSASAFWIVHPHFDTWTDHIEQFGMFYVDKSRKGHFTIGACRLNRRLWKYGWEADFREVDVAAAATQFLQATTQGARARALHSLKKLLILS
ncbi:hypothetical protein D0B54_23740 [Solimonas sp. K1W22B-7]|uniref:hypothetical protein n=1 Tax=Solimonas sp. K1W22B-7 TaxID=2303331 RepID=UPI000E32D53E|nr:hypothetical protein [Solimonas sp. K1W22B-7]AXQ31511.1 hypothetical protein D0B54_23740 [Solimonas sp. K1W22B-7]